MARYKYATFGELIWKLERALRFATTAFLGVGMIVVLNWLASPFIGNGSEHIGIDEPITAGRVITLLVRPPGINPIALIVFTAPWLIYAASLARRLSHKRAMIVAGLCECCKHDFEATPDATVCPACKTPRERISNLIGTTATRDQRPA